METKSDIFETRTLERGGCREYWINSVGNFADGRGLIQSAVDHLKALDAEPVSIRLFGNQTDLDRAASLLRSLTDEIMCPALMITQNGGGQPSLRIQIHAVSGMDSRPLYWGEALVGRTFEDDSVTYYMLNVLPDTQDKSQYAQAKEVFEKAHQILTSFGLDFSNTIRTWLYASDILSWYDELNRARNEFFSAHGIYDKIVPASTGIGMDNPAGAALVIQLLAVAVKNEDMRIEVAESPLQNSALDYKSSFSRGIQLMGPDQQRLYVSGTASIDAEGRTVFVDDVAAQVDLTMRVVEGILDKTDMQWRDAVSGLVYFKNRSDFGLFDDYCKAHKITLPHIKVCADVCRDDLLFELELDAVKG